MRVLIAGGGIGGLTAALACLQQGHDVVLVEQADVLKEVGAGLQLSPNAMQVLRALGLTEQVKTFGFAPKRIETRMGISGRYIFTIPLAERAITRWGAPYYHIHRADLIKILEQAVRHHGNACLVLGCQVNSYQQKDGVSVTLSDGQTIEGDVLIGADGIHSTIQTQMLGKIEPRFTGNMAWRATVPIYALGDLVPPPTACAWMGRGRHCVTYRIRGGDWVNFVGVVEQKNWNDESWTQTGSRDDVLSDFEGWHPILINIIKQTETFYKWGLFDRAPLPHWVDGRVALLGDAAHPMLPFMAQGAVMAIEDSWVLAQEITNQPNVEDALLTYQNKRKPRASRVQTASRKNAGIFHRKSLLSQLGTYGPMWAGARLFPEMVHRRMDWLYGEDVTSAPHGNP